VAGDLDAADRRAQLAAALGRLRVEAAGLPRVGASLEALAADSDRAWRLLAAALLADELSSDC